MFSVKKLHIINPTAGKGAGNIEPVSDGEVYVTKAPGDAVEYVRSRLSEDGGEYRVYAYGGDGTLKEAVTGIMRAEAGSRVILSPVPVGSGNDFARITEEIGGISPCDVIKYNSDYAINEINTGFDTGVVVRTNGIKKWPLVGGTLEYILGVVGELAAKRATDLRLTAVTADGRVETFEGRYLLCLFSNGVYYGGGFKAAPTARIDDGELDLILADDMSRRRFIGLVGKYRAGEHLTAGGAVIPEAEDILIYRRCRTLRLEGVTRFSADGEVMENDGVIEASVIPSALRVAPVGWEPGTDAEPANNTAERIVETGELYV